MDFWAVSWLAWVLIQHVENIFLGRQVRFLDQGRLHQFLKGYGFAAQIQFIYNVIYYWVQDWRRQSALKNIVKNLDSHLPLLDTLLQDDFINTSFDPNDHRVDDSLVLYLALGGLLSVQSSSVILHTELALVNILVKLHLRLAFVLRSRHQVLVIVLLI